MTELMKLQGIYFQLSLTAVRQAPTFCGGGRPLLYGLRNGSGKEKHMDGKNLTLADLLKAVDWEINRMEAEDRRSGLSVWLLGAAFAGVFWTLLSIWDTGKAHYAVVLTIILGMSIFGDAVYIITNALWPTSHSANAGIRYKLFNNFETTLPALAIGLRYIVLCLGVYFASTVNFQEITIAAGIYCSVLLLLFVVVFFLGLLRIPLPLIQGKETSREKRNSFPTSLILILSALIGCCYLWKSFVLASPHDWRVGVLITTCGYLILMLSHQGMKKPLLENLLHVRRELALGRLDLSKATQETEIAIFGLGLADVFQNELDFILQKINTINAVEYDILQLANAIEEILSKGKDFLKEKEDFVRSSWRSIDLLLGEAWKHVGGLEKAVNKLDFKKALFVPRESLSAADEYRQMIAQKIGNVTSDLRESIKRNGEKLAMLEKKIKESGCSELLQKQIAAIRNGAGK